METKIALIELSKFVEANYNPLIINDFTEVTHRNTVYKKIFAFTDMVEGYQWDYVFDTIEEYNDWFTFVPKSISKLQAVSQLLKTGLYANLIAILDADETGVSRILFDAAAVLDRDSNMVNQMALALQFSSEDTDAFFVEADNIFV